MKYTYSQCSPLHIDILLYIYIYDFLLTFIEHLLQLKKHIFLFGLLNLSFVILFGCLDRRDWRASWVCALAPSEPHAARIGSAPSRAGAKPQTRWTILVDGSTEQIPQFFRGG